MNAAMTIWMSIAIPVAAFGVYNLQARLERWDYDRHLED